MPLFKGSANNGTLYVVVLLSLISMAGFYLIGGQLPAVRAPHNEDSQVIIASPSPGQSSDNLQMDTFTGVTVTPSILPSPTF